MVASAERQPGTAGLQVRMYSVSAIGGVRWRLLGGNNRELGRGALEYPDGETCRVDVVRILHEAKALDAVVLRADPSRWTWRLRRDGVDVVMAAHAFHRRSQCGDAMARFVELAHTATVTATVTVLGARRRLVPGRPLPPPRYGRAGA
jgi:hypothetical protein